MWTHFWDMNSGGGRKEPQEHIFIEAPEDEAKVIFYNRFGHNPERVTCSCCGEDYSISSDESLEQLTAYHRNCDYDHELGEYIETSSGRGEHMTMLDYFAEPGILFIKADSIKPDERTGTVPAQGYVWVD